MSRDVQNDCCDYYSIIPLIGLFLFTILVGFTYDVLGVLGVFLLLLSAKGVIRNRTLALHYIYRFYMLSLSSFGKTQ